MLGAGRRWWTSAPRFVIQKIDPRGKAYYWIGGVDPSWKCTGGTDYEAVSSGWISLTPLHLDLTNHGAIDLIKTWKLSLNGDTPK